MSAETKDEGPLDVEMVDLKFMVATLAKDNKWYVRAAFATKALAEAYAQGMASVGVQAKIVWDEPRESERNFCTCNLCKAGSWGPMGSQFDYTKEWCGLCGAVHCIHNIHKGQPDEDARRKFYGLPPYGTWPWIEQGPTPVPCPPGCQGNHGHDAYGRPFVPGPEGRKPVMHEHREHGQCETCVPHSGTIYCGKCGRIVKPAPGGCESVLLVDQEYVRCNLASGHPGRHQSSELNMTVTWLKP